MGKIASAFLSLIFISLLLASCEREDHHVIASVTDRSDCKNLKSRTTDDTTPDTLSCISYAYDISSKTLLITHINAGFNCCPGKLNCRADIAGDTLIIRENQAHAGCRCDCMYDLEISVERLESQQYTVKIVELFCGDQQELIFEADLPNKPAGSFCALRKQYPWGMGF